MCLSPPSVMVIPPTGAVTISPALITPRPSGFFAKAYSALGVLLLLELFAQFYFIAAAVIPIAAPLTIDITWKSTYDTFSALHGFNGTFVIPATILVLILLSVAARQPWKTTGLTALLLLLLVLQFTLALRLTWQRWAL
jgi:hypothetical protein